jgi:hypothetical protein
MVREILELTEELDRRYSCKIKAMIIDDVRVSGRQ